MERKHNAPLHRRVIDGTHLVINQIQQKGRMLRRVLGGGFPELPGARLPRERDVSGMCEQMLVCTQRKERERDRPVLI